MNNQANRYHRARGFFANMTVSCALSVVSVSGHEHDAAEPSMMRKYLSVSCAGAARGLAGIPLEHPLDCVKTKAQAKYSARIFPVVREVLRNEGVRGFYAGVVPNTARIALKQFYRWPLMVFLPRWYLDHLPEEALRRFASAPQACSGITIAALEVFLLCPLERIKVWLMTGSSETKTFRAFLHTRDQSVTAEFFRGLKPLFYRQMFSWTTFLVSDDTLRRQLKSHRDKNVLDASDLLVVSFGTGVINTLCVMPLDCLKTHCQKQIPLTIPSLVKALGEVRRTAGWPGVYAGWQVQMIQYMIQSGLTMNLLRMMG